MEREFIVVDAFSRKFMGYYFEILLAMISFPNPKWLEELKSSYG